MIITSRHPSWAPAATRIDVDVLTRTESVSFLATHVSDIDVKVANDLAAELGDLPLALGQAAAYLEASDVPPAAYLRRFRQRRARMLSKGTDLVYGGSLETAWSVTLEKLQRQAPEAVALLELVAFCAPEPVPLSVFAAPAELLPASLASAARDDPEAFVDDAVSCALAYSCAADAATPSRCTGSCKRSSDPGCPQSSRRPPLPPSRACSDAATPGDPDIPATWSAWAALAPHILHLWATANPDDRLVIASLMSWLGWYLFVSGDLAAAQSLAASSYETCKSDFGADARVTLDAAANLATILGSGQDLEAATALARDTLERRRRLFGEDDPGTLHAANNLPGLPWQPATRKPAEISLRAF